MRLRSLCNTKDLKQLSVSKILMAYTTTQDISATAAQDSVKVSFLGKLFVTLQFPIIVCVVCLRITWPAPGLVVAAPDGETQQNYVKNTKDNVLMKARDAWSFRMTVFKSFGRAAREAYWATGYTALSVTVVGVRLTLGRTTTNL